MSLVFPNDLAAPTAKAALAKGAFWIGFVFLVGAFFGILILAIDRDEPGRWPALVALGLIAGGGFAINLQKRASAPRLLVAAAILLVGLWWYTLVLEPFLLPTATTDYYFLTLPKIAIVMFGAATGRFLPGVVGCGVALVIAEGAVATVAVERGHAYALDVATVVCFLVILGAQSLLDYSRKRARTSVPHIAQAAIAEERERARDRHQGAAAALVHDTVLNELAVVASVQAGPLPDATRRQIQRSLAVLSDEAWSVDGEGALPALGSAPLQALVEFGAQNGVTVEVTGAIGLIDELDAGVRLALVQAIQQCLSNVARHARIESASVTVIGAEADLAVMITDAGVGFVPGEIDEDRLGLRASIRGRVESVGGRVQVWSSEGAGTSVLLTVPR